LFPKRYWLVIITFIIMQLIVAAIAPILHFGFGLEALDAAVYAYIGSFIVALIITLSLMRNDLREERLNNPLSVGKIIGWSVLGVFLAWFSQAIAVSIEMQLFGIEPTSENTEIIVDFTRSNILFILIPAMIAPVLEEIIFRKILFGTFYKKMNFFFAALLSSFIFAVLHLDFEHLLIYATMGFVFAFLYVQTKRIIVPIIVHMTINTIAVLGQLLIDPEMLEQIDKMQKNIQLILLGGF